MLSLPSETEILTSPQSLPSEHSIPFGGETGLPTFYVGCGHVRFGFFVAVDYESSSSEHCFRLTDHVMFR